MYSNIMDLVINNSIKCVVINSAKDFIQEADWEM